MANLASQVQPPINYNDAPIPLALQDTSAPPAMANIPIAQAVQPSPEQQAIDTDRQKLQKVQWAQNNPWGTPENHPGTAGKIAHVLSVAGNIAGDIVAPNVMARIPGTQLNREAEEGQLSHRIGEEEQQNSENQFRNANTAKTQEETAEAPGKAKSEQTLQAAQTGNLESETNQRNSQDQSLAGAYAHAVQQAIKENRDPAQDPIVQHLSNAIISLQPGQNKAAEAPKTIQIEQGGRPHQMAWDEKTGKYDLDQGESGEKPPVVNVNAGKGEARAEKNDILKAYQPTLDSAERMNVMTESYEKAVKDHDQQAMLNLLANHLGMTMGLQKGARMTKDIVREAQQSQPWLQGMAAKFDKDGYLSGVTLSPNQMRQMVNLGQSRYAEDAKKSRATAQYLGAPDDGPERIPGKATINFYLGQTGGDVQKAKQLATQDGWSVK